MITDTICQICTPLAEGAISIIRVSGDRAIEIVNQIFTKDLTKVKTHTITYGYIMDGDKTIDEVLVSVFYPPRSFTAELTVEINCHGGLFVTRKVLELLVLKGCRLAENGEFTRRAFMNGRIDLTEAESVMDVINAKTDNALALATSGLKGNVSGLVNDLKEDLIQIIGVLEVNIDYPEYDDVEVLTEETIVPKIDNLINKMKKILKESTQAKIIRDGIKTAIIGKPNVGKSSLLNILLEEDKAIVTNIEGTTRDLVEGRINIDGLILNLVDTAGIRSTEDLVEQIGIERSLAQIHEADLILLVLDNTKELNETDKKLLEETKDKKRIVIVNKVDEETKLVLPSNVKYLTVSAAKELGIRELKDEILSLAGVLNYDSKGTYLSNIRHITNVKNALQSLEEAKQASLDLIPLDLVLVDLLDAFHKLDEIIGKGDTDLIGELFKRFCLGK